MTRYPTIKTLMSSATFFAALVGGGHAGAVPIPTASCPEQTLEDRTSAVFGASEQIDGDTWRYGYRVCNTSRSGDFYNGAEGSIMIDWELPYFADAGITNFATPQGWAASVEDVGVVNPSTGWGMTDNDLDGVFGIDQETGDPLDPDDAIPLWTVDGDPWKAIFDEAYGGADANPFNDVEQVIHFYWVGELAEVAAVSEVLVQSTIDVPFCGLIFPGEECVGFGFDAAFGPGDAPYQASWLDEPVQTGDPAFPLGDEAGGGIPNSPSIQRQTNDVPEPSTLTLAMAIAPAAAIAGGRCRRRRVRR